VTPHLASARFEQRLRRYSMDVDHGSIVVPIGMNSQAEDFKPTSVMAAMTGIGALHKRATKQGEKTKRATSGLMLRNHAAELAFAVTDYKLQGATTDIIVLSLGPRSFQPAIDLTAVYVLASRVRTASDGLRVLKVPKDWGHLKKLRHDAALDIWSNSYDGNGKFAPELAKSYFGLLQKDRQAEAEQAKGEAKAQQKAAKAQQKAQQKGRRSRRRTSPWE
jgi:hypothetical protein